MAAMSERTILVAVRLPASLVAGIDERAKKEGSDRSAIMRNLLAYGVREVPSAEAALGKLVNQVTALRHAVERMEKAGR
jgi:metal-responsive CopG/Arc/MetJ family transcriptional regulator